MLQYQNPAKKNNLTYFKNRTKVELNKEGQIEVKEFTDNIENQIQNDENSEQTQSTPTGTQEDAPTNQDISVTTDITASPTDSYPPNEPEFYPDETGKDGELNGSLDEVSIILSSLVFLDILKSFFCVFLCGKDEVANALYNSA